LPRAAAKDSRRSQQRPLLEKRDGDGRIALRRLIVDWRF